MAETNKAGSQPASRDIIITRLFDAPRDVVFNAWIDPAHLAIWWGPKHFTNPVCEVDARVGGKWHIVMRGPDGAEYPCGGVYREIIRPERLVFTNDAIDKQGNVIIAGHTTVTFANENGKTRLTLQTRGTAMVDYAAAYLSGMEAGWTQSLEKLGEHVARADAADREIVISRVFEAPRELVWEAIVDPKQVIRWWGPRGFTTTIEEMDVRPGGVWKHVMHGPDGTDYPNYSVFDEVVKPERIAFSHGGGKKGVPGVNFIATWTLDALNGGSKTKVTVRMVFPSAADRDIVVKEFGAIEGGKQTLERLGEHLGKR